MRREIWFNDLNKLNIIHELSREVFVGLLTGRILIKSFICFDKAGVAQLVEHQPSKLRVAGSSPVSRSKAINLYC